MKSEELIKILLEYPDFHIEFFGDDEETDLTAKKLVEILCKSGMDYIDLELADIGYSDRVILLKNK